MYAIEKKNYEEPRVRVEEMEGTDLLAALSADLDDSEGVAKQSNNFDWDDED